MPEKRTIERARKDRRAGKAPSTQAGEFVREEIEHIREGKHGAASAQQAIAIGLSKARRAGVKLPAPAEGAVSEETRRRAERDLERGRTKAGPRSRRRAPAATRALRRKGRRAASRAALSKQARSAARKRGAAARRAAARRAARTKGPRQRSAAARKAARTRAARTKKQPPGRSGGGNVAISRNAVRAGALVALLASAASGEEQRCRTDALRQWYCPTDPRGVAVIDSLGAVVCAPGRCVQFESEWHCSSRSGGSAELTPTGPVCDGECRAPRASNCEKI
jgi:hypothetical protein